MVVPPSVPGQLSTFGFLTFDNEIEPANFIHQANDAEVPGLGPRTLKVC